MTDHLHPVLDDAAIARMTILHSPMGDAVYEILVRTHLACGGTSDREKPAQPYDPARSCVRAGGSGKAHSAYAR